MKTDKLTVQERLDVAGKLMQAGRVFQAEAVLSEILPDLQEYEDFCCLVGLALAGPNYGLALRAFSIYREKNGTSLRADESEEDVLKAMGEANALMDRSSDGGASPELLLTYPPLAIAVVSAIGVLSAGSTLYFWFRNQDHHQIVMPLALVVSVCLMLAVYLRSFRIEIMDGQIISKSLWTSKSAHLSDLTCRAMAPRGRGIDLDFRDNTTISVNRQLENFEKLLFILRLYLPKER